MDICSCRNVSIDGCGAHGQPSSDQSGDGESGGELAV